MHGHHVHRPVIVDDDLMDILDTIHSFCRFPYFRDHIFAGRLTQKRNDGLFGMGES